MKSKLLGRKDQTSLFLFSWSKILIYESKYKIYRKMIINFLFPGDVIEIDINNERIIRQINQGKTKFMITSVTFFDLTNSVVAILVNVDDVIMRMNRVKLSFGFKGGVSKLSVLTFIGGNLTILDQDVKSFRILNRNKIIKEDPNNYCEICSVRKKHFCNGEDKNCEFYYKDNKILPLSLGDKVKIKDSIGNFTSYGIIQTMYLKDNTYKNNNNTIKYNDEMEYEAGMITEYFRSNDTPFQHLFFDPRELNQLTRNRKDVEIVEKGGINIKSFEKVCNRCILSDCSECNIKLIKDFIK